jgi:hypothetical protein
MRPDFRTALSAFVFVLVLGLALAWLAFPQLRGGLDPTDPGHALHTLEERDEEIAPALAAADAGDPTRLVLWLNRTDADTRLELAHIVHGEVYAPQPGRGREPDNALCWKYRTRLRAFVNISTGDDELDLEFDNLLAYAIATGPTPAGGPGPTPAELDAAKLVLLRLREAVRVRLEKHQTADAGAIEDTIGCVLFATGDFAGAREAFTSAMADESADMLPLAKARLAAATANVQAAAAKPPGALRPLPQESEYPPDGSATAAATATAAMPAPAASASAGAPATAASAALAPPVP